MKAKTKTWMARDVMTRKLVRARPWQFAREAARLLDDRRISGAPVVDAGGRLLGVVTLTDLVQLERGGRPHPGRLDFFRYPQEDGFLHGYYDGPTDRTTVRQVMTKAVVRAPETMAVADLARLMRGRRIHRVFITHRGRLTGVVSALDLLKVIRHGL